MKYLIIISMILFFIPEMSLCQMGIYTGKFGEKKFTLELEEVNDTQMGMGYYNSYTGDYTDAKEINNIANFY